MIIFGEVEGLVCSVEGKRPIRITKKGVMLGFLAVVLISGCATQQIHPGTANQFDSDAYNTLLISHSVIESTKSDISAGSFPPNVLPAVKIALNGLIDAYNALDTIYCNPGAAISPVASELQCSATSYHALALAGTAPNALLTQMQAAQWNLNNAVATLSTAKGKR